MRAASIQNSGLHWLYLTIGTTKQLFGSQEGERRSIPMFNHLFSEPTWVEIAPSFSVARSSFGYQTDRSIEKNPFATWWRQHQHGDIDINFFNYIDSLSSFKSLTNRPTIWDESDKCPLKQFSVFASKKTVLRVVDIVPSLLSLLTLLSLLSKVTHSTTVFFVEDNAGMTPMDIAVKVQNFSIQRILEESVFDTSVAKRRVSTGKEVQPSNLRWNSRCLNIDSSPEFPKKLDKFSKLQKWFGLINGYSWGEISPYL